jgi:signal peptidase I
MNDAAPRRSPRPWLAALLCLPAPALGMLYARRPWLALAYFVISNILGLLVLFPAGLTAGMVEPSNARAALLWTFVIVGGIHAYVLAARTPAGASPWYSRWYGLIGFAAGLGIALFVTRAFVFEPFRGSSTTMYPTITPGTTMYVSKLGVGNYGAYGLNFPEMSHLRRIERTDVVAYRRPDDPQQVVVHRVIGLPGDHIVYLNRQLSINDVPVRTTPGRPDDTLNGLNYRYVTEVIDGKRIELAWIPERAPRDADVIVPPGHFMVMGDNRDNVKDSRYVGMIPHANILGVVSNVR